jgi:hypothetical protein
MKVIRDIKWHRLLFALFITLLMADAVPHPKLSPGLVQSLVGQLGQPDDPSTGPYFSTR